MWPENEVLSVTVKNGVISELSVIDSKGGNEAFWSVEGTNQYTYRNPQLVAEGEPLQDMMKPRPVPISTKPFDTNLYGIDSGNLKEVLERCFKERGMKIENMFEICIEGTDLDGKEIKNDNNPGRPAKRITLKELDATFAKSDEILTHTLRTAFDLAGNAGMKNQTIYEMPESPLMSSSSLRNADNNKIVIRKAYSNLHDINNSNNNYIDLGTQLIGTRVVIDTKSSNNTIIGGKTSEDLLVLSKPVDKYEFTKGKDGTITMKDKETGIQNFLKEFDFVGALDNTTTIKAYSIDDLVQELADHNVTNGGAGNNTGGAKPKGTGKKKG